MKQRVFVLFFLTLAFNVHAQYKKAGGVFGGSGFVQTFSFGAGTIVSPGFYAKPPVGFQIVSGADKKESRWFQHATVRILLPADFAKKTQAYSYSSQRTTDVVLTAKTTVVGMLDYSKGIYFNKESDDVKLRPYAVFGIGFQIGNFKEYSDNKQQLINDTNSDFLYAELNEDVAFGGNVQAAVGLLYMFTKKVGVKADAGYLYVPNFKTSADDQVRYYGAVNSGAMINLRLHFKFEPKE